MFTCGVLGCGAVRLKEWDMKKHRRNDHGIKPYPCPICPERFSYHDACVTHQKTHVTPLPSTLNTPLPVSSLAAPSQAASDAATGLNAKDRKRKAEDFEPAHTDYPRNWYVLCKSKAARLNTSTQPELEAERERRERAAKIELPRTVVADATPTWISTLEQKLTPPKFTPSVRPDLFDPVPPEWGCFYRNSDYDYGHISALSEDDQFDHYLPQIEELLIQADTDLHSKRGPARLVRSTHEPLKYHPFLAKGVPAGTPLAEFPDNSGVGIHAEISCAVFLEWITAKRDDHKGLYIAGVDRLTASVSSLCADVWPHLRDDDLVVVMYKRGHRDGWVMTGLELKSFYAKGVEERSSLGPVAEFDATLRYQESMREWFSALTFAKGNSGGNRANYAVTKYGREAFGIDLEV